MAVKLGALLELPVIHLDKLFWQPGWIAMESNKWRDEVRAIVDEDKWIIDGNFDSSLDIRLPRADSVIYLDFATSVCIRRVVKRILTTFGKVREDMAEECPERIDVPFIKWVWRFRKDVRPAVYESVRQYYNGSDLFIFHNPDQVNDYLQGLKISSQAKSDN